ncbi:MAG: 50S ribosomal protein L22 [Gemmatimonadetes bacterium]|uniref:Large ribosomal subunit protein uL22 n=1 Tax=Candidatus Kutchimonas denitrificans TaxID=3056748 RepID=A0AAE4Z7F8_9BACT|nr:50S ribosomal protein L22 [Gemmatimonadota bacterium]NIR73852.1 50S ribosomal protein L22 [Candidatus Kutchimonas denitrificans]NIR99658.1 50S ribosomal protein L22 [Gemmatimonadota bacterium]NIT65243.1 50S ribosomal protein L22 [Gemmatimonadota bacterium]NIW73692.1 50S ribosomal protein L22 [Gemmatimonadota bacterium]
MEAKAIARFVRQSPRKMRLVADQIRGQTVNDAYAILQFSNKRAARSFEKTLRSAVANALYAAEDQGERLDVDDLYIKRAFVDEGPTYRRWRARAMGRASPIRRRTSHVTVIVDRKE